MVVGAAMALSGSPLAAYRPTQSVTLGAGMPDQVAVTGLPAGTDAGDAETVGFDAVTAKGAEVAKRV